MKEVILHIGTHKTGTTSIQRLLAENVSTLLKDHRILYPIAGRPNNNFESRFGQHKLAWSLLGIKGVRDKECWKGLHEEANQSSNCRILLSAEAFSRFEAVQLKELRNLLNATEKITVVLYLRNPEQYMLSVYKQRIKSKTAYAGSWSEFLADNISRCDYPRLVQIWSDTFGPDAMKVRVYENELNYWSLEDSFLKVLGITLSGDKRGQRPLNRSISDSTTKWVRWINGLQSRSSGADAIYGNLQKAKRWLVRHDPGKQRFLNKLAGSILCDKSREQFWSHVPDYGKSVLRTYLDDDELSYLQSPDF